MKAGYLSQYFTGVAAKILTAVETDGFTSNQHEFNGVSPLKKIFGAPIGKVKLEAKFLYLNDSDDEPVVDEGFLTWYDAREKHPTRSECRLYFPTTTVSMCAAPGDLLVIAQTPEKKVLTIICEQESTIANQVKWLFGLSDSEHPGFSVRGELESEQDKIAFASSIILEQLGIELKETAETYLDDMREKFGEQFPKTSVFSEYARSTVSGVDSINDPDGTLIAWVEREEILFRTFEKHIIAERLNNGFGEDMVDDFIAFSLSVQNRRKSRVGYALEHHIEQILLDNGITCSRTKVTENKSKPDFIFPSIEHYNDENFDTNLLTMLGSKSTCKDRWRQVLSEADRIEHKHLLTLQAAISENQTNEMKERHLQLVVPRPLHYTYSFEQQQWLMDLKSFINLVRERQEQANR